VSISANTSAWAIELDMVGQLAAQEKDVERKDGEAFCVATGWPPMATTGGSLRRLHDRVRARARQALATAAPLWPYYLVMYAVAAVHLAEVHLLDPVATELVRDVAGSSLNLFATLEAPVYEALETVRSPRRVAGVSAYYLVGFLALLAWTPQLVAASGDRDRLRRVLLTYPFVYLVGLPGYLLVPQLNPYVALELADPFTPLAAGLERTYYLFTTPNNTFPSLHVAFTAALTVQLVRSRSPLVSGAALVHGGLLIASVVYLRVHWIGDVVGGLAAAWLALWLADRAADGTGRLGAAAAWLDEQGRRGS
jgi:membrane-associated phospholipid phosphatase